MLLFLTSRSGLIARYGIDAYDSVSTALLDFQAVLRDAPRSLESDILVVDDPPNMTRFGMTTQTAADGIAKAVREVNRQRSGELEYVVIVGGPEVIPFHLVTNQVFGLIVNNATDPDPLQIPCDVPYGCKNAPGDPPMEDVPVGRFLTGTDGSVADLVAQLQRAGAAHAAAAPIGHGFALLNSQWSAASGLINVLAPSTVELAPSFVVSGATASELGAPAIFFDLHGSKSVSQWWGIAGGGGQFPAVDPFSLALVELKNTVIFAANCYGAFLDSKGSLDSCAIMALARGARAFVGSATTTYGIGSRTDQVVCYADELAGYFFERLAQHETAGNALRLARRDLLEAAQARFDGSIDHRTHKTLVQFLLLGDPSI
jgi:hypothetical protein